jgi:hypothetical protein
MEGAPMTEYNPNSSYVEAMSAILIEFFVPPAGEDDLLDACIGQLIETYLFDGLQEEEAARIVNSQIRLHRSGLNPDDRIHWLRTNVSILPCELRERTFAMLAHRLYHASDGKLDPDANDTLDRAAELLCLSPPQSEKIIQVCKILNCPIA